MLKIAHQFAAICLISLSLSWAGHHGGEWDEEGHPGHGKHHFLMADALNLSPEQKEQIKKILKENRQESKDKVFEKVMAVLNEEQKPVARQIHEHVKKGEVPPQFVEAKVKRLDEKLGLSEDQKTKIKAILTEAMNHKFAERKEYKEMDKKDKAAQKEKRKAHKEDMKKQHQEVHKKIAAVLTQEQQKKFKEMKKETRKKKGQEGGKKKKANQARESGGSDDGGDN